MFADDKSEKIRLLNNTLSTMSNILWAIQHGRYSHQQKIDGLDKIRKTIPDVVRLIIYLMNTEKK